MRVVCFCKQKTAYEMRISDWSSNVALPMLAKYADALAREPRSAGTCIDLIAMHEKADRMIARVKARNNYALVKSMQRLRLIERVCFYLIDRDAYVSFDWIEGLRTLPGPVQPAVNLHSESLEIGRAHV